jgi:hypothetical protein
MDILAGDDLSDGEARMNRYINFGIIVILAIIFIFMIVILTMGSA